jgi:hypothetical protein
MTGHDPTEPRPDDVERGRDALRELRVEPLPADVLARLEGRLEGALGRPAPSPSRRRGLPRLAFALPGAGVALAAAVIVAVVATHGSGSRPPKQEAAISMGAKAAPPKTPEAAAGRAGADSSAAPTQKLATQVQVPALVGHGLGYLNAVTGARGLKWAEFKGNRCPPVPGVKVRRQVPVAGATVASGSTIRVSFGKCVRYDSGS